MFAKHYHIFTYLLDVIQCQALMEKVNAPFLILGQKVKRKSDLTKAFMKLGNMPKLINSDDKNTLKFLVKTVYFGNVKDIENINLNEMRQHQFTSNDLKKITSSSDALNMHSLRAVFIMYQCHIHRCESLLWKMICLCLSGYLKFLSLTLQNFFEHANAKQESAWHANAPSLVSQAWYLKLG